MLGPCGVQSWLEVCSSSRLILFSATQTLDACVKITKALRVNLVTVADAQNSAFGDVVLGVDVLADNLMWDMAKSSQYVREASSEEEPVMVETNPSGRFTICWDPLDGSSIVDNNFAVGTIVGTPFSFLVALFSQPLSSCRFLLLLCEHRFSFARSYLSLWLFLPCLLSSLRLPVSPPSRLYLLFPLPLSVVLPRSLPPMCAQVSGTRPPACLEPPAATR